ncbi:MAG: type II toxin-antitoxin system VapC family toxin [Deltaproteobacteria bacterium]|nr:MAG: type II toxin-antitoxin system VapC family toxin [Deltaproteobacteria bacterium]
MDTTFLIDLQNERRGRGRARGATDFLRSHPATEFLLPMVALGKYLEGFDDPSSPQAQALVEGLQLLPVTRAVATLYAQRARTLRGKGQLPGTNDLWIACTASEAGLPIVTRNTAHFRRVEGLEVVTYEAPSPADNG